MTPEREAPREDEAVTPEGAASHEDEAVTDAAAPAVETETENQEVGGSFRERLRAAQRRMYASKK